MMMAVLLVDMLELEQRLRLCDEEIGIALRS